MLCVQFKRTSWNTHTHIRLSHVQHSPVQRQLLQLVEVAGNVLERGVRDARTPGQIEGAQLLQVLGDQLDTVVGHLAAAGQRQHGEVGQRMN